MDQTYVYIESRRSCQWHAYVDTESHDVESLTINFMYHGFIDTNLSLSDIDLVGQLTISGESHSRSTTV